MKHRVKGKKLGRTKQPREMMLNNLAASVIIYEKVKTTEAKAKAVKPLVEKAITIAAKGGLSGRRELIRRLPQPLAVKKSFEVLAVKYKERKGGYCRIVKLGSRSGDGAKVAQIELV